MGKETIIKVENLGKKYKIGEKERYLALRDSIVNAIKLPCKILTGKASLKKPDFWALKDISFEVKRGEVIGIIGRNGAGKSTLLKILSRITEPTTGKVTLRGRVASLLEVGTGFHPELTGRENIYLNGAILGMTKKEINRKFDEIVDFSRVEKFLDTPVKRYSSGMRVRIAFSVAAHLEPEILLIDEVLAVGDASFQKKCLGKMKDVASGGRTVLFVSHNMAAVNKLCKKTILLSEGKKIAEDKTRDVIDHYCDSLKDFIEEKKSEIIFPECSNKDIQLKRVKISFEPEKNGEQETSSELIFDITINTRRIIEGAYITVNIMDYFGSVVYWAADIDSQRYQKPKIGKATIQCRCPKNLLTAGNYLANFAIVSLGRATIDHSPKKAINFEVKEPINSLLSTYGISRPGFTSLPSKWLLKNEK